MDDSDFEKMKKILKNIPLIFSLTLLFCVSLYAQSGTTQYVYDENGRLRAVISPSGETAVYEYDEAGNIVSITRRNNPIVSISSFGIDSEECVSTESLPVSIFGTGFAGDPLQNTVTFNGAPATVETTAQDRLVVRLPQGFISGVVRVTNVNGSAEKQLDLTSIFSSVRIAPNNAPQNLNILSEDQTLTLCFEGTAERKISFLLQNVSFPSLDIKLVGTSGEILSDNNYPAENGQIFIDSTLLSETGTYFVRISSPDDQTGSMSGALYEFDDITAYLPPDGTPANVSVAKPGQNVKLQSSTQGASYNLSLENSTINNYSASVVRNFDGQVVSTIYSFPATISSLSSEHSIIFNPVGAAVGNAEFKLEPLTISTDGTPEEISISPPSGAGRTFAATAGQSFGLQVSNVNVRPSIINIIKPDGQSLTSGFIDFYFTGTFLRFTVPTDGVYTVLFTPYFTNSGGSGIFSLTLLDEVTGTLEINDPPTTFTSTEAGQSFRLTFAGNQDQRFVLKRDQDDFFSVTLTIFKPDGTEVLSTYGFNWDTVFDFNNLPQTGIYTILIQPNFPNQFGNLTLQAVDENVFISNTEFEYFNVYFYSNSVVDLTEGSTKRSETVKSNKPEKKTDGGTSNLVLPTATYFYNGTANEGFSFSPNQSSQPTFNFTGGTMTIFKPDGTLLESAPLDAGLCNITLPENGTYRIEVAPDEGTQSIILMKQCGGGGEQFGDGGNGKKGSVRKSKPKSKVSRQK